METLNAMAGREIRAVRTRRGHTLVEVGEATGLSPSYLSEIERGRANITLATLEQIAEAFEVSPIRLLGLDDNEHARRVAVEQRLARIAALAQEADR